MCADRSKAKAAGVTRRGMILMGGIVGGVLVVGYTARNLGTVASSALSIGASQRPSSPFGPFIEIDRDGWVTVLSKHQEMGQGVHLGLAAIVAEELDADWSKVRVKSAPAIAALYANGEMGVQTTAGSNSIANSWQQLRRAGAAARDMFVQAAARHWNVQPASISVQDGIVSHVPSGRSAGFGELMSLAAEMVPPADPVVKDNTKFKLINSPRIQRKDAWKKATGATVYTQDVQLPGMLVAMVAHAPRFGEQVASVDAAAARTVVGVVDIFQIPSGVAVVAQDTWSARKGRDALLIGWNDKDAVKRSSEQLRDYFQKVAEGRSDLSGKVFESVGDASSALVKEHFQATYDFPYLPHAAMEPLNCVAQVDGRRVKLTFASQLQTIDQVNTALTALTLPGMVQIETLPAGGSFGRRGIMSSDYVVECVHIARHVGGDRPIKLVWTREDDMCGGYYRPMAHHRVQVERDSAGLPKSWRHSAVAQSLLPFGGNEVAVEGVKGSPYLAVCTTVEGRVFSPVVGVPVGFWRSVGNSHSAMVMEHTIDQLARLGGHDPVHYRRLIYKKAGDARRLAVMELACQRAGWDRPIEAGWARGLAVHVSFETVVAQIAEVGFVGGRLRVRRVVCAVDCGIAVAPDQVAAQMEGGICYGLSAALYGKLSLDRNGRPEQTNFDAHEVLRHHEAPVVETYIVPSRRDPSGVGEPGVPPIAPAVANALLALTGKPTTSLPFFT